MKKFLIALAILVVLGVITYLVIEFKVKKWKCKEGKCEKVIGGDYSSLEKCKQQCKVSQKYADDRTRRLLQGRRGRAKGRTSQRRVSFSPDLVEYA